MRSRWSGRDQLPGPPRMGPTVTGRRRPKGGDWAPSLSQNRFQTQTYMPLHRHSGSVARASRFARSHNARICQLDQTRRSGKEERKTPAKQHLQPARREPRRDPLVDALALCPRARYAPHLGLQSPRNRDNCRSPSACWLSLKRRRTWQVRRASRQTLSASSNSSVGSIAG